MTNPLKNLAALGQSIWLDYIKRDFIINGELKKCIEMDELRGVTSNPSIFDAAVSKSNDYDEVIQQLTQQHKAIEEIYNTITQSDVRDAADIFSSLYHKTETLDGYVSLEVNPYLAHNTNATIEEARQLWQSLNRSNVMIKVPGTKEGIPAIQQLISEGINVNVTLLFSIERYQEAANAYLTGLETRLKNGQPIQHISSVASFFLSRIDVLIDPLLDNIIHQDNDKATLAKKMQGEVAIASARLAYQLYKELINTTRFKALQEKGARPQRLLWASTSTKNPNYPELKYVEALIGPETVNTLPKETLEAYRNYGNPKNRLEDELPLAKWIYEQLPTLNLSLNDLTNQLEREGVDKFKKSYDQLITAIKGKMQ